MLEVEGKAMIEGRWAPLLYRPDLARGEDRILGVLVSNGAGDWWFLVDEAAVMWLRRDYGIPDPVFGRSWAEGINGQIADMGADELLARPEGYAWGYQVRLGEGRYCLIEDEPGAVEREANWLLARVAHPPAGAMAALSGEPMSLGRADG